jgi:hypothetical protein
VFFTFGVFKEQPLIMNKLVSYTALFSITLLLLSCESRKNDDSSQASMSLSDNVKKETLRTWHAYCKYAWPHDGLLPISGSFLDWYSESINISPIDSYSTLKLMGFDEDTKRIENFVVDSLDFNKDIFVKVFEVNIRLLGGLLYMYQATGDERVLQKAKSFADRLLPAFKSPTALPYYYVNLKTGATKGAVINVAEAGSYLFEFGILSYYTADPTYYQIAKTATKKIHSLRSSIDLLGRDVNIESGKWELTHSMVGAYTDSYFEYLYKSWLLFHDPEIKAIWDVSVTAIQKYIAEEQDSLLWYGKVDMYSGEKINSEITLWDAYFTALLALSGDLPRAKSSLDAWDYLWDKNGLVPMVYDYKKDSIVNPFYQLNPEVIESAYYLWHYTKDSVYYERIKKYYLDINRYCKTEIAYCHVENVVSKKQKDEMETFFIAENMKYFYLGFATDQNINPTDYVFSTEAHPFKKSNFTRDKIKFRLGID